MNTLNASYPVAVLSAVMSADMPVAVLSQNLQSGDDGWFHLLPAGHFSATDGRPKDVPGGQWYLDAAVADALIAYQGQLVNDRPVDYEHQTLNSGKNGQPAPAAGRFNATEIQWRDSGLWIKPRLTPRAQKHLDDKEYIYLSAVFPYNPDTGHPLWIHSVALTNDPGLDGLHPITSLRAESLISHSKENVMHPLLMAILKALGVQVVDDKVPEEATVMAALTALQDKAGAVDGLTAQVAALKAAPVDGKPDPAQYVPIAVVQDLQTQIAALSNGSSEAALKALIKDAKDDGRLLPSMESWAEELGNKDFAALKAFLDKAAPVAALKSTQTSTTPPPVNDDAELTAEDKAVLKATGLDKAAFLKAKKELTQ